MEGKKWLRWPVPVGCRVIRVKEKGRVGSSWSRGTCGTQGRSWGAKRVKGVRRKKGSRGLKGSKGGQGPPRWLSVLLYPSPSLLPIPLSSLTRFSIMTKELQKYLSSGEFNCSIPGAYVFSTHHIEGRAYSDQPGGLEQEAVQVRETLSGMK